MEQKVGGGLDINDVWPLEGQPPFKELKLDEEAELEEENKRFFKLIILAQFFKVWWNSKGNWPIRRSKMQKNVLHLVQLQKVLFIILFWAVFFWHSLLCCRGFVSTNSYVPKYSFTAWNIRIIFFNETNHFTNIFCPFCKSIRAFVTYCYCLINFYFKIYFLFLNFNSKKIFRNT